ncbi:hypothetical protein [Streptomyces sp. URMC 129]|uniref:hypothetical protein n=1 Tax=Streptomyces sp. URMC 129 TaxID=3423407 RepID=UPI003F1A8D63
MRTPSPYVLITVEIDTNTVRRGDQLLLGGHVFTVRDLTALPSGSRRLDFTTGETFIMSRTTVLWATRRVRPHLIRTEHR